MAEDFSPNPLQIAAVAILRDCIEQLPKQHTDNPVLVAVNSIWTLELYSSYMTIPLRTRKAMESEAGISFDGGTFDGPTKKKAEKYIVILVQDSQAMLPHKKFLIPGTSIPPQISGTKRRNTVDDVPYIDKNSGHLCHAVATLKHAVQSSLDSIVGSDMPRRQCQVLQATIDSIIGELEENSHSTIKRAMLVSCFEYIENLRKFGKDDKKQRSSPPKLIEKRVVQDIPARGPAPSEQVIWNTGDVQIKAKLLIPYVNPAGITLGYFCAVSTPVQTLNIDCLLLPPNHSRFDVTRENYLDFVKTKTAMRRLSKVEHRDVFKLSEGSVAMINDILGR